MKRATSGLWFPIDTTQSNDFNDWGFEELLGVWRRGTILIADLCVWLSPSMDARRSRSMFAADVAEGPRLGCVIASGASTVQEARFPKKAVLFGCYPVTLAPLTLPPHCHYDSGRCFTPAEKSFYERVQPFRRNFGCNTLFLRAIALMRGLPILASGWG